MIVSNTKAERNQGHGFELGSSYEIARAADPMTVLEDEMSEEQTSYFPGAGCSTTGAGKPVLGTDTSEVGNPGAAPDKPTPDQQIRMKALECAVETWFEGPVATEEQFWPTAHKFEDYIKNGRD